MVKSVINKGLFRLGLLLALIVVLANLNFSVHADAAAVQVTTEAEVAIPEVVPPPPQWVEQVYIDPASISLTVNEDMHVVLGRSGYDPSELEFRVHQTRDSEWFILRDWSAWPMQPIQSAVVGTSALQVDIRHKEGGEIQREWIGTYYFRQPYRAYPSLYRVISSTLFEVDDRGALSRNSAQRAEVLFSLLADPSGDTCLNQCSRRRLDDGSVTVESGDVSVNYDPALHRVTWPGAPIDIKLDQFTQYNELRQSLLAADPNFDDQTLLIAFAAQFVHRGFWVGSPSEGMIRSHFDVVSMCNTFSFTLIRLLGELGIPAEFVSYENSQGGAHAIVQVKTKRGTLLVDAMEGRIILGSVEDVVKGVEVRQVSLPSFQNTGIDLVADLPSSKAVWISESIDLNRGQAMHQNPMIIKPRLMNQ